MRTLRRLTLKQLKKKVEIARNRMGEKIERNTDQNSLYSRELAREGYRGGYEQCLMDVGLLMIGLPPYGRERSLWE